MIFIGLDVSKNSSAMCIEKENNIQLFNYTTKKENNIWIQKFKPFIQFRFIQYKYTEIKNYSKSEIMKLKEFDKITDLIISDINNNTNKQEETTIKIEGYSYNSRGPIFDLIEFTTILKNKIINTFDNVEILSPLTLKNEACKFVYEPRIETLGTKKVRQIIHIENKNKKLSKNFDKWDMLQALMDSNMKTYIKDYIKKNWEDISKNKEVPKPLDDIIDAIWLCKSGGIIY